VDRSILDPGIFIETNVKGTAILLEAAKKYAVKKYIQISTDEVYGSVKKGKSKEGDMLDPTSPYAASKTSADLIAMSYFKTYGVPVTITRSSNNYGPYQHPEKFIPLFITNAIEGKNLPIYGDGMQVRNWIYVEDNCKAIDVVLHKGRAGEIYNIGGNVEVPNILVAKTIVFALDKDDSILNYVKDRLAHDRRYALSSARLKKLGWKPGYSFKEALKLTIKWYTENEKWWRPLKGHAFSEYVKKAYGKK
jgi:dTDP-glucose 4,6-dehydratase